MPERMPPSGDVRPARFLPGVPGPQVEEILAKAPGNELGSGKFDSPVSSAALAVNAFGFFLDRPGDLPPLPGCPASLWSVSRVELEKTLHFPWRGGRHPWLDAVLTSKGSLIGIESKRFEPFRNGKTGSFSDAFWRPKWGQNMKGYQRVRDRIKRSPKLFVRLDAAQLVKHALALRTEVSREREHQGFAPILFYVYAEPRVWPEDGSKVDHKAVSAHRQEVAAFAKEVAGDEVRFLSCTYLDLLASWERSKDRRLRRHAAAVIERFSP